jgi:hypothetical protein
MKPVYRGCVVLSFLLVLFLYKPSSLQGQEAHIEPLIGLQHIYSNAFLGEARPYSTIMLGANFYYHYQSYGIEASAVYADNKFNDAKSILNLGIGISIRLNDGLDKGKVSAFLSAGPFFNGYGRGFYGQLRMRAEKFSYGFRYQAEVGPFEPKISVASLTIGFPISTFKFNKN